MRKLILFLLIPAFFSCADDDDRYYEDTDIVTVQYDNEYMSAESSVKDYQKFSTYFLPDTIHYLVGEDDPNYIEMDASFDELVLLAIQRNLDENLKLTAVNDPQAETASVNIMVSVIASKNIQAYASYPWHGSYPWWGGYYSDPYWGGFHYPYLSVVEYDQGDVIIEFVDTDETLKEDNKYRSVWLGKASGLIQVDEDRYYNRVEGSINKAFELSPYLIQK